MRDVQAGPVVAPTRRVPFLDLRVTDPDEREALLAATARVLDHGRLVLGPEVAELEQRVADLCGRRWGVGVGSGSDALLVALRALDLQPGDEVITTSLSWIATTNAIALAGGTPVFADIDEDLNLDPESVARLLSPRTRALLPVHYTGKVCRMEPLQRLASEHGLALVEDAAQAFGATAHGQPAGGFGLMGCFSMNPMKVLAACGEAGVVVGDDEALRDRLTSLRYNGTINREECREASINARIDTLQAAMLLCRLDRLPALLARRRELAAYYGRELAGVVRTPRTEPDCEDVFYTYQIQADRRDELKLFLEERGIETKIQHPILMPDQPAYRAAARAETGVARRLRDRILCLPANEKLTDAQAELVAATVQEFYGG